MQSKELVLTSKDLTEVGIDSRLTSNDLVEVVAHDIYDKLMETVEGVNKKQQLLIKEYHSLMNPEIIKMRRLLVGHLEKNEVLKIKGGQDLEEDDFDDEDDMPDPQQKELLVSYGTSDDYWPSISINYLKTEERDKGTIFHYNSYNANIPLLKSQSTKVKLVISGAKDKLTKEIKTGNISGEIVTTSEKMFKQIITIPTVRFKEFSKKVKLHNEEVERVYSFLPKKGAVSVERFTREARVKMNKKIISAQSPDFRKKISELFNIKL